MARMFEVLVRSCGRVRRVSVPMRWLMLAVTLGGFAAGVARLSSQAPAGGLQQGIDTIRQILAEDGRYTRSTTSARNNYKSLTERRFSLADANGCNLTVQSDSHVHVEMPTQNRVTDRKSSETFRPDFSVLDPASVYVADPQPGQASWQMTGYLVRISVEVGKPPIRASSVDKEANGATDLPGVPTLAVYVTSRQSADRLAKAFAQVATACHATPAAK